MNKRHILRALTAILACSILSVGAIACGSGDTEDELARIDKVATQNLVDVELMKDRLDKAEEANTKLTERLDTMEKANHELVQRIALGGMGGGATPSFGPAYDAATEEQRQLVRTIIKDCPALSSQIGNTEQAAWSSIGSGTPFTIDTLQIASDLICN